MDRPGNLAAAVFKDAESPEKVQPEVKSDHSTILNEKLQEQQPDVTNAIRGFSVAEILYLFNILVLVVVLVFTKCRFLGYLQSDRPNVTYIFQRYTQKQSVSNAVFGAIILAIMSWLEKANDAATYQYCYIVKDQSTLALVILVIVTAIGAIKHLIYALLDSKTEKFSEIKDSHKKFEILGNQQFQGTVGLFVRLLLLVVIIYGIYLLNFLPESFIDAPKKSTICMPKKVELGVSDLTLYYLPVACLLASVVFTEALYKENKPFRLAKILKSIYFLVSVVLTGGGWIAFLVLVLSYNLNPSQYCLLGQLFITADALNTGILCISNVIYTVVTKFAERNRYAFWPGN